MAPDNDDDDDDDCQHHDNVSACNSDLMNEHNEKSAGENEGEVSTVGEEGGLRSEFLNQDDKQYGLELLLSQWQPTHDDIAKKASAKFLEAAKREETKRRRRKQLMAVLGGNCQEKDADQINADSGKRKYSFQHRKAEVQVFPHNLQARWDDNGCLVLMAIIFCVALIGFPMFALKLKLAYTIGNAVSIAKTPLLIWKTLLLSGLIACAIILLTFAGMCFCGLHTQMMAARKRHFGSLQKSNILIRMMFGKTANADPLFQKRLRKARRRVKRLIEQVEDRQIKWDERREIRIQYMKDQGDAMLWLHAEQEADATAPACAIL